MRSRIFRIMIVLAGLALAIGAPLGAQRRASSLNVRQATPDSFDGKFQFCRIVFSSGSGGDFEAGTWRADFPRADINLSVRLSELTKTDVSRIDGGEPNNVALWLSQPELFSCPFIMMTEVGAAELGSRDIPNLRAYLQKGGFLWVDDFWGEDAWKWWMLQLRKVLPEREYPVVDINDGHPLYHSIFEVARTPQIANIGFWSRGGGNSERGAETARVHTRAVLDRHNRIMVLMTHNTDIGDSFEREADDPSYFLENSVPGYAFGVNALVYAMTH
jgi:hypothetical protein